MNESTLLKISLLTSLSGIFLLIIISETTTQEIQNEINDSLIDSKIKVQGNINKIFNKPTITILEINYNSRPLKIIAYSNLSLKKNQVIQAEGILKKYKGELEVEADKVTLLS